MCSEHGCSRFSRLAVAVGVAVCLSATAAPAQTAPAVSPPGGGSFYIPDIGKMLPPAADGEGVSASLQILVLLTVLTLVPSILVMVTAFPRVIIVLALLRQAIGTQQLPPAQVLLGLSLFVTMVVMAPVWHRVHSEAVTPYFANEMGQSEAFEITSAHLKDFMCRQITQAGNYEDVYLFLEYTEGRAIPPEETIEVNDLPLTVVIPAFMLSELKTAFIMGFRIYLPFLVIDMVIATILISMGMMMLPPVLISLPFKILLFVLADGWHLVVETLLYSFV